LFLKDNKIYCRQEIDGKENETGEYADNEEEARKVIASTYSACWGVDWELEWTER